MVNVSQRISNFFPKFDPNAAQNVEIRPVAGAYGKTGIPNLETEPEPDK